VTLCEINGLISLPPFIRLGHNFFLRPFGQKSMSRNFFSFQGPVGPQPGAKKTVICQAISAISRDIGPKIEI
jgi:hypothetical protein